MKKAPYIILVTIFLWCCKPNDPNFEYLPLESFVFEPTIIEEGTRIQILSFSGGPECSPQKTFYYQFIGINKKNNDTVRILSPCQKLTAGNNPIEGVFYSWKKQSELIDKALKEHGEGKFESEQKVIVFNKSNRDIEKRNYKTTIGTLGFE